MSASRRLVQNAIRIVEADVYLKSTHIHDYQSWTDGKATAMTDGGCEYLHRGHHGCTIESYDLYTDDTLSRLAPRLLWGTYGKDGKGPFRWVRLCDCETDHLKAILSTQAQAAPVVQSVIVYLLVGRP